MFNFKPSKPLAIFVAIVGAGMLIFAWSSASKMGSTAFLYFWSFVLIGIVGFNLWSAFSKKGATEVIEQTKPIDVQEVAPENSAKPE